ncbi:MAG: 16S rRNA (adenine(1518)-N(6)/adenine(1519)-N(6))-dimethyltransferase RsmA [bacterium]
MVKRPIETLFKTRPDRGQHFLQDSSYVHRILNLALLEPMDEVIEIGSGLGALTIPLTKKVSRVVAIEWDNRLVKYLKDRLSNDIDHVMIIKADVMSIDFKQICKGFSGPPVVIGNLPYYLATALIQRLLLLDCQFSRMVFMLQKEVAERIVAKPGTKAYGYLSLMVEYFAEAESLFEIPPSVFKPQPKVQSSVVRLILRSEPPVKVIKETNFFQLIKSGFKHRRKTLINALKLDPQLSSEEIEETCKNTGFERKVRAEALTLEDFARLSNALVSRSL